MPIPLNLVEYLERLSLRVGRPIPAVLAIAGTPAIETADADAQFEAEALAAWEEYQPYGEHVTMAEMDDIIVEALARARTVAANTSA